MTISQRPILRRSTQTVRPAKHDRGFTLIESIVSMLVIAAAVAFTASLIFYSSNQFRRSAGLNELNELVESDLARVRTANDRLVCATGACVISGADPNRNAYFPAQDANFATNRTFFNNLCVAAGGTTTGFANRMQALWLTPNPSASNRIARAVVLENGGHRYTLVYTDAATGDFLRQATLVPTTVAWCPNNIQ
jgi:prepilin-type N-terminal cleavage/methylation domain-containing protein